MLEEIFGSKTRHRLLRLFFKNTESDFFVREMARRLNTQINAVRRELERLQKAQIIMSGEKKEPALPMNSRDAAAEAKRKYFRWNKNGPLNQELQAILLKDEILSERNFIETLKKMAGIDYLVLSGRFSGAEDSPTDLLVVGNITHKETQRLVRLFEGQSGEELRYTVMPRREFLYRRDVADRFLTDLFGRKHVVAINRLGN